MIRKQNFTNFYTKIILQEIRYRGINDLHCNLNFVKCLFQQDEFIEKWPKYIFSLGWLIFLNFLLLTYVPHSVFFSSFFLSQSFFNFLLIDLRERERERNINLLFHLLMHSLVDSCVCPDWGLNLQLQHIRTTLHPTELPSQGFSFFLSFSSLLSFLPLPYILLSFLFFFSSFFLLLLSISLAVPLSCSSLFYFPDLRPKYN